MPDGKVWGYVASTACLSRNPLVWKGSNTAVRLPLFASVFQEELREDGFTAESTVNLFEDKSRSTTLMAGALITDMDARFCAPPPFGPGANMSMTVEWQIYDELKQAIVLRITTTGETSDTRSELVTSESIERRALAAFRVNIRGLLANLAFRQQILAEPSTPKTSATNNDPLQFLAAKPGLTRTMAEVTRSVVTIVTSEGHGTGFVIADDGYLLTNHHVAGDSGRVRVHRADGTDTVGEVVRGDRRRDVALIKTTPKAPALVLRHTQAQLGETVFAIGTPLDKELAGTLTRGVVSSLRLDGGQSFIQSDVAVTHGNSGGPLLDEKGQVLGITDWGLGGDSGNLNLNFFIPIDDALRALALTPAPVESPQVAAAPAKASAPRKR